MKIQPINTQNQYTPNFTGAIDKSLFKYLDQCRKDVIRSAKKSPSAFTNEEIKETTKDIAYILGNLKKFMQKTHNNTLLKIEKGTSKTEEFVLFFTNKKTGNKLYVTPNLGSLFECQSSPDWNPLLDKAGKSSITNLAKWTARLNILGHKPEIIDKTLFRLECQDLINQAFNKSFLGHIRTKLNIRRIERLAPEFDINIGMGAIDDIISINSLAKIRKAKTIYEKNTEKQLIKTRKSIIKELKNIEIK